MAENIDYEAWLKEIEEMRPACRTIVWTPEMDKLLLAAGKRVEANEWSWARLERWWSSKGLRGGRMALAKRYERLKGESGQ